MNFYQLKIVVAEKNFDEFIESLRVLSSGIRKEQGCLDVRLYRNLEKKDVYGVSGQWQTRQAMEAHFRGEKFSVLIGAARVLCEEFKMSIGEILEEGSYPFAQKKISQHPGKGKLFDIKS